LIIGAGCSLEEPTGLKLATEYSMDIHSQLIRDGVLQAGDCDSPADLSVLTSTVWERDDNHQRLVVERLPLREFRFARPNDGYLIAAALLREGALSAVLTLNFDIAMSTGLTLLSAIEVDVVPGPAATAQLGTATVIYLHRNVDEPDPDRWILRTEALRDEWRGGWQEVVTNRVMSCPVVVFAGLGSPAGVLTETVSRVRQAVNDDQHHVYVVDPAESSDFHDAIVPPPDEHIQLRWCDLMHQLAARVVQEFQASLVSACRELCDRHGWTEEIEFVTGLSERLHEMGLVDVGKLRAAWLLDAQSYLPDHVVRRALVADLLLGVGLVERELGARAQVRANGVVELRADDRPLVSFLAASGAGTMRWTALEPKVREALRRIPTRDRPRNALVSAVPGGRPAITAAPDDLVGDLGEDIVQGGATRQFVTVDEIRDDAAAANRLVA
jgi:hypothetical protein